MIRQPMQAPMETGQQRQIEQFINETKKWMLSVENNVAYLEEQQETFLFKRKTFTIEFSEHLTDPNMEREKMEIQKQLEKLVENRKKVLDPIKKLFEHGETFLSILVQEITKWQRLSCIGANTNISLKHIEVWVTEIVEVFLQLEGLLGTLCELSRQVPYNGDPLTDPESLLQRLREMLRYLVQKSFVVDKQPAMSEHLNQPLVVKTLTQFSVRARLLVKLPNLSHNTKVSYVLDKDPPNIKGYRRFRLSGSDAKTLEDAQGEGLVVQYKHLQLKAEKAEKRGNRRKCANDGSSTIMEELHIITFVTQVHYEDVHLHLEAATLPFVVISNLSQFKGAFASVLWFNLLSSDPKDVTFFSKPPAAPWKQLAEALSWQFSCCTKRGLNSDQREMLGEKLCGKVPQEDSIVTWRKFAKGNMPTFEFTFWSWFTAVVDLVKTHLENIWNAGYVMGFVSRNTVDALLKTMQQGTFLLRFSESICDGGITYSWVDHYPDGTYFIHSVEPYTKEELKKFHFAEIICNYQVLIGENLRENPLKYLYPNIPKDEAFGSHNVQATNNKLEYRKRRMIMVSESKVDDSQTGDALATPLHSPETTQNDHNISEHELEVLTEEDLAIDQILNEIHMEDFLMQLNIDPMISGLSWEYNELPRESSDQ